MMQDGAKGRSVQGRSEEATTRQDDRSEEAATKHGEASGSSVEGRSKAAAMVQDEA